MWLSVRTPAPLPSGPPVSEAAVAESVPHAQASGSDALESSLGRTKSPLADAESEDFVFVFSAGIANECSKLRFQALDQPASDSITALSSHVTQRGCASDGLISEFSHPCCAPLCPAHCPDSSLAAPRQSKLLHFGHAGSRWFN